MSIPDMSIPARLEATFMAIDALAAPDVFVLWALRQRLEGATGCSGLVSIGFHRVLGSAHATTALAAFEAANGVLATRSLRCLRLLPPSCRFITHDEVCLLSLRL